MTNKLKSAIATVLLAGACALTPAQTGSWTPLATQAPETIGYAILLSDGTVMAQGYANNTWYRLSPDSHGSYVNGTWTTLAPMNDTRLFFFAQLVKDGRVVLGGGEYGTGGPKTEYYQPLTNTWTSIVSPGVNFYDGVSTVLPNGNVLAAPVFGWGSTLIFNLISNTWSPGPAMLSGQDEAAWVTLPDSSVLTIDPFGTQTERFIPSLNRWVRDAPCPVQLYGYGGELGAGYLLPNGKVIFFGATSNTAIYTPSGTPSPGTWTVGPVIPGGNGQVDAPGTVMPNGKVLMAAGTTSGFGNVSYWYEYDYKTNSFTPTTVPTGGMVYPSSEFIQTLLNLPDGTILQTGISPQLYVYTPAGPQLPAAKPAIKAVVPNSDGSYHLIGTQFNGINQGAAYGDDWQMSTNFPIARLTSPSGKVYYARTYNWSSTGVMTGSNLVTTEMSLPASIPAGNYNLSVIANGVSSDPVSFISGYTATAVSVYTGTNGHGTVDALTKVDGNVYQGTSVLSSGSQVVNVEADFTLPSGLTLPSLSASCSASAVNGATGFLFMYDWQARNFVYLGGAVPLSTSQTSFSGFTTGDPSRFIGPGGEVRVIVKASVPAHQSPAPFTVKIDQLLIG